VAIGYAMLVVVVDGVCGQLDRSDSAQRVVAKLQRVLVKLAEWVVECLEFVEWVAYCVGLTGSADDDDDDKDDGCPDVAELGAAVRRAADALRRKDEEERRNAVPWYSAPYNKVPTFHHQLPTVGTSDPGKSFGFQKGFPSHQFPGGRYIPLRFEQKSPDLGVLFPFIITIRSAVHGKVIPYQENPFTAFNQNPAVHEKEKYCRARCTA
jgi:hypothetical protein